MNPSPRPASHISSIDGALFDDAVLESSSKGKEQANESDDDLPTLPAEPSTPPTKTRWKDGDGRKPEASSSPPPTVNLEQPRVEFMHKAISKFDLRDDEWMMVEDEFLETAKLFTRHLHIAEYDRLKEMIEAKKKDASIARPVVPNANMSAAGAMKEKARVQEQKQKKATRDVFASQDDDEAEAPGITTTSSASIMHNRPMPAYDSASKTESGRPDTAQQPPSTRMESDTESEDLDAPRPPTKPLFKATTTSGVSKTASHPTAKAPAPSPFAKPAPLPTAAKPRSRRSRATPFDMLDDWVPRKPHPASPKASLEKPARPPLPAAFQKRSATAGSERSSDGVDGAAKTSLRAPSPGSSGQREQQRSPEASSSSSGRRKSTDLADRLAKRKADRETSEGEKKKKTKKALSVDDIPTFLF